MTFRPQQFLYSDRAIDPTEHLLYVSLMRNAMRHLGIEPDQVSVGHPGPAFMLLGMRFFYQSDPRADVDTFLDDELGIPHVSTPAPTTYLQQLERGGLQPKDPHGRDPGDETRHR